MTQFTERVFIQENWKRKFHYHQTGETTAVRRAAVWETSASRHHMGRILKPPVHYSTIALMGLRGALNWASMMQRESLGVIFPSGAISVHFYTEKTKFPFPFTLNGIWSWWQFSFRFWTKWNSIWCRIEGKLSPRSYPIQFERKRKYSFLSVNHLFSHEQ